ncbi:3-oxoacid CoA-transferase subunit B [Salipaludibacillus aurantiacus]|uniref:Acetate CoA/acetoacetate CoA-transferase beta subunit n=1 Tax=Salipaludibacillus aurantiacus TaxID=1601833 RepID=A0A1H9P064_9BACI|nr:3-oxoacid CoA-transferase subunit B [Salipaludibacillus aurantiacus]SER41582.1 acetate CoA/acetoacetate CoA-transferase beta subunit [Salipaludibacillus aurantiacus]
MGMGKDIRHKIAARAAKEIKPGMIVNLGIGIPTLVADYTEDLPVMFHAENGILGTGPSPSEGKENPHLCNAGGFPVTTIPGGSYFDSATAFAIVRRGLLDLTIMGALEVSEKGDLANWIVPGKRVPGMGGALELAQKARKVMILMNHVSKDGRPKIVKECSLPLTAAHCVNQIITDMAVISVEKEGLVLDEVFEPYTVEKVKECTGAPFVRINTGLKEGERL